MPNRRFWFFLPFSFIVQLVLLFTINNRFPSFQPGMFECFKKESKMFACLVGALSVAASKPTFDYWYSLRFETLNLLTVVAFINDDQFEVQGLAKLIKNYSYCKMQGECGDD